MGFILNIITVLIGTALGVALGNRLPERVRETVLNGLGLATLGYASLSIVDSMANQTNGAVKFLVVLFSIVLGGIAGEALGLDAGFQVGIVLGVPGDGVFVDDLAGGGVDVLCGFIEVHRPGDGGQ